MQKPQMRAGNYRDEDNHFVLHEQNDRCGPGPIETIESVHNVAVVNAQDHDEGWDL